MLFLRAPSFLEPAWHTDEGTFAGVAEGVLRGKGLYSGAWESKPPLFLYTYVALFKLFGAGVLPIKAGAAVAALSSQLMLFLIGLRLLNTRRALVASMLFGVLMAVPFWGGNLALSEIFSMPPMIAAVFVVLWQQRRRTVQADVWMAMAGVLFGVAFLIRQPALLALPAVVVWLYLAGEPALRRRLLLLGGGLLTPVLLVMVAFAIVGSFNWFWNANVTYFLFYVPTGNRLTTALLPVLFLPLLVAFVILLRDRFRGHPTPAWSMPALWFGLAFVGSLINGKDYSHYLLQTFPPLALMAVALWPSQPPRLFFKPSPAAVVAGTCLFSWVAVVGYVYHDPFGRHWTHGINYYEHIAAYVSGRESEEKFDRFFDKRVSTTKMLDTQFARLHADGKSAYIWGEYPWVYALSGLDPFSRYVTSYYPLESDERGAELIHALQSSPPNYLVLCADAEPKPDRSPTRERFVRLQKFLRDLAATRYDLKATVGNASIYALRPAPREQTDVLAP